MITRKQLIKKYIEFFKSKNHKEIQNASLIPENDPTTLFIGSGMETILPFLQGQKHPLGKRITNIQRCIRTGDIEEVGNSTHHTFFEMIGNWSFGDYWKEDAIKWSFEFATKILKLPKEKLAVTVFGGDKDFPNIPKDDEAAKIWESLGIPKERIAYLPGGVKDGEDNWWGPVGQTGPCGPCTEMFFWRSNSKPVPEKFNPEDKTWVEIWNDVLMQYNRNKEGNNNKATQKNIDNGRGLERVLSVINNVDDNYLTEIWQPIIQEIEKLSKKSYKGNEKAMRIIADHIKAATMIIADGITPGPTEQGYIVRRLIRRAIRYSKKLGIPEDQDITTPLVKKILKIYDDYGILKENKQKIINELNKEEDKFEMTLDKGLKQLKKMIHNKSISGEDAFLLYQSYGFPIEITKEIAKENGSSVDEKGFQKEFTKHQKLSRTASAGQFKSGLADNSEQTTKLHSAAHLLLQALKITLKDNSIEQRGSNINPERLRLDFSFPRKLTPEEIKKVEDLVNSQIQNSCEVLREEMTPQQAKAKGACGIFNKKYKDKVSVYSIGKFSKEICTGPHVKNTCEIGKFKIKKEQSSSSGVRRIKAIIN